MQSMNIGEILQQGPVEASAPCRIDMGGTLDLSTFFLPLRDLKPCTFNAALNLRTRVRISTCKPGWIKVSSRGFDSVEFQSDRAPYDHPLGLMLAVAAYFNADGIHIDIHSASPPRSALGGSSAAAAALIWAFYKTLHQIGSAMPERGSVALLAHALEQSVAGVPCGMQDQLAAVFGGANAWHWTADPTRTPFERQVVIASHKIEAFERRLMVAYCGAPHESKDVNGTWVRQFVAGRYRDQWREIARCSREFIAALAQGDYRRAQAIMNQETAIRRHLTPEVLDDVGQELTAAAIGHGCGARFTGAGGGGCIWALGAHADMKRLRTAWQNIINRRKTGEILETRIDNDGLL